MSISTPHHSTRSTLTPQHRENLSQYRSNIGGGHETGLYFGLEAIIGSTVTSVNALSAAVDSNTFAFCAGSTVVLATIDSQLRLHQRFFNAKPDALPAQATPSYYNPATPTRAAGNRYYTATPSKDDSPGPASFDANVDVLGKFKPGYRSRSLTSVALSPSGKHLAIGEVRNRTPVAAPSIQKLKIAGGISSSHTCLLDRTWRSTRCASRLPYRAYFRRPSHRLLP